MRIGTTLAIAIALCAAIPSVSAQTGLFSAPPQSGTDAPQIVPLAPHQEGAAPFSPNETHPNAKRLASEVALALTTYSQGETAADIAARLPYSGNAPVELAQTLYVPGAWSQGRILYPQLGGLGDTRASVMVVTEQIIGTAEDTRVFVRTLDVRLRLADGQWRFDRLASAGGTVTPPPQSVSPEALAVLNEPRIELPDSARWDILSGQIAPNLLVIMARLAELTPYGVVTLSQGHPYEVFGTDKQSDHTRGLAVDIYRIGNDLVIDNRAEGSKVHDIVRWLYDQPEIRQIGSPWALDGFGGRSFTDRLHQDHLHVAVLP